MKVGQSVLSVTCCIAGGGPAGMMLGLLLARAGIEVAVLEKHADFLRDFRGDTIHPSTLQLLHELGLLDEFLQQPHQKVFQIQGFVGDREVVIADFSRLPVRAPFIAFMPQWDFLNFLLRKAADYACFKLLMQTEVSGLVIAGGQVGGVIAQTPDGVIQINSDLLIGADGRDSKVRNLAGLKVRPFGAPIDVLWFRLSRRPSDPAETQGRFLPGRIMVMINRGEYWQCAYVIPKGRLEMIQQAGIPAFAGNIGVAAPFLEDRLCELESWDQIKLLTVKIDMLEKWFSGGLLCIGDAAHAMSPVGGVGINLAIQDAVAAANILSGPLRSSALRTRDLARVQKRRAWPARMTQRAQLLVHRRIIQSVLQDKSGFRAPLPVRLLDKFPALRRITGHAIGIGLRPEHITSPDARR